jgi:allantoicase
VAGEFELVLRAVTAAGEAAACVPARDGRVAAVEPLAARLADPAAWADLLPRTRLLPDTRHRFPLDGRAEVTHARLDVFPDGGMARLRLHGQLAPRAGPSWPCAFSTCSPRTTPAGSWPPKATWPRPRPSGWSRPAR